MNRSELRLVLGALLAAAVPAGVLHFGAAGDRRAAGLTAPPFGWPRVLVAHLVAALPLGFLAANWVRTLPAVEAWARGVWVALGLAAGLAVALGPGIGEGAAESDAGPVALLVLRSVLSLGLVLPWCVAATDPGDVPVPASRPGLAFGVTLGLAVVPCGLYADSVAAARTEEAADLVGRERPAKAQPVVEGLCELGSERRIGKQSPGEVRKALAALVPRLRKAAGRPLPDPAPPAARIERAVLLVRVDRLAEAAELLEPLAAGDDPALMLLASVYRDLGRWAESDDRYAAALDRLLPRAAADADARGACRDAFEGLAFNARSDGRPADAERVLRRGLDDLHAEAAYFHFQLGRHYADGGQPGRATDHLRTAADLDPAKHRDAADKLIRELRTITPACLPRSPGPR